MKQRDLRETFLTEADELLADFEQGLVSLETTPDDQECIHRVFRAMHTLKSGAGMLSLDPVVAIAHVAEGVLERVRSRSLALDAQITSTLLSTIDVFNDMLACFASGGMPKLTDAHQGLIATLHRYVAGTQPQEPRHASDASERMPRLYRIELAFTSKVFATGQDPGMLLLDLGKLGKLIEVRPHTRLIPEFDEYQPDKCYLGWTVLLETCESKQAIHEVFLFVWDHAEVVITDVSTKSNSPHSHAERKIGELLVEDGYVSPLDVEAALRQQKPLGRVLVEMGKLTDSVLNDALAKQRAARQRQRSSTIRVDTEKLDRLVNLVGELVIAVARVSQTGRDAMTPRNVHLGAIESLDQIGRDLQTRILSIRMVPIEETFSRFKRVVRDTALEVGKLALLETFGDETELDKNVIEQLADPLKHMVRNAVAHGIESPNERIRVGKSDTGRVRLNAAQRQGHIVIEVTDDGRGIDPARVLSKAKEKGLLAAEHALTDKQVLNLIFEPGFSTAEEVNEISGRGVGLDVVARNVKNLRGKVELESTLGVGTTFRILLPLTLAIVDGMNVRVGRETLSIPLQSVVELFAPRADQLFTVEGRGELVDVRGEYLPVVRLSNLLDASSERKLDADTTVVVVENNARKFGMLVDRVLGMEQAVVKPLKSAFSVARSLDRSFSRPEGVAGATILGDGHVGLILDVPGIERMAFGEMQ